MGVLVPNVHLSLPLRRHAPPRAARATIRDIGEILDTCQPTAHKRLGHVFGKLGVEPRTAAAGLEMARVRQLAATR